jgi:hypothetical protein
MYKAEQFDQKAYRITTDLDGVETSFNVIVANDASELDELVEVHLNSLKNLSTPVIPENPPKSLSEIVAELQATVEAQAAEIAALKNPPQPVTE